MTALKQLLDPAYEVRLPVFEGPLDLLLYLVEKNELHPKDIAIADITDQYLEYLNTLDAAHLAHAGEFLVMAARLMRLKARELLPADQKDELEEMEYLLDRQALIAQMLEYQKFKEAARSLRAIEARHFGAFPRGCAEVVFGAESEEGGEAGIYDLLTAFRAALVQAPRIPVHEVEIDDVTIEDRMQHIESELRRRRRSLFEDLFEGDPRRMAKVVTFMAILELCKLDRIHLRQHRGLGAIWVYAAVAAEEMPELQAQADAAELDPLPEFRTGLVDWVQEQIRHRKTETSWEKVIADLAAELQHDATPDADDALPPSGTALRAVAAPDAGSEPVTESEGDA